MIFLAVRSTASAATLCLAVPATYPQASHPPVVHVEAGTLQSTIDLGVIAFKGIPNAAPPLRVTEYGHRN